MHRHMAKDELREMAEDKWSDELWGLPKIQEATTLAMTDESLSGRNTSAEASTGKAIIPRLYFYWAREDHWIANSTRDAVIASRAWQQGGSSGESGKPFMEIAADDVPHAFCLRHNESVAKKCAEYVKDVQRRREDKRSD